MLIHKTSLRKVGGSVVIAVPPALLDALQLRPGVSVGIAIRQGRLVIEPRLRPRYTLSELLAKCDPKAPRIKKERDWTSDKPLGKELI